jgi:uncharacterized membrane protein
VLKFLLALHLVLAVFVIGPLVWAATTAGRGVRTGDGAATAASARILRMYAYVSVLVVGVGFGLMSQKKKPAGLRRYADYLPQPKSRPIAEFSDTWIWLSLLLWAIAVGLVLLVIVPTLNRATRLIEAQESVVTLTARIAAAGGVVGLLFIAIVVLMAYKPGS